MPCYCLPPTADLGYAGNDFAEQTAGFLDVTGLSMSEDFMQYCGGQGPYRQSCDGDGGDMWGYYNRTNVADLKRKKVMRTAFTSCQHVGENKDTTIVEPSPCERKGKCEKTDEGSH